ncbi:DUF6968 family protein [Terricaulis silvestris]|uniref:DUF6968 domain-containing protein n=1 Tax=Terricaulis silvestris TaxID=2686094 RepID=A0A6I6MQW3_9CAUL|nr:hypothetical protein [Terricaulis silvestris]QGZ95796.1 hypothetical protein DSM104635_02647 [Terricaulis silvestris]
MTVIVERELEIRNDVDVEAVVVRVHAAEKHPRYDWGARVELSWDRSYEIFGVDPWQAVQLAMRFAPSAISSTTAFKEGRISLWGTTARTPQEFDYLFNALPPREEPKQ